MASRRGMIWVVASLSLAAGLLILSRMGTELRVSRAHPVVGRVVAANARTSPIGAEIAGAAAVLDEPSRSRTTREALRAALADGHGETLDFGIGQGDSSPEVAPATNDAQVLPTAASGLLKACAQPLLVLRTTQPAALARIASRRGWIGPLAAEVFGSAQAISLSVDEDRESGWVHVTLALEFPDGAAAEAGLARLTSANGDFGQLGFIAEPGYERIVRRTALVVIRLDARTETVASHLRGR